jgi:hypothetical protein
MATVNEVRDELAAKLAADGLNATTDPRAVVLPGVLVGVPPALDLATGCVLRLEVPVYVVAPPPGDDVAVRALLELVPRVMAIVGVVHATVDSITLAGQADLPCYTVTWVGTATTT